MIRVFGVVALFVAVVFAVILSARLSVPSYQEESIEFWFTEVELRIYERDVINNKKPKVAPEHLEAFLAMAPESAEWLGEQLCAPASLGEKLFRGLPRLKNEPDVWRRLRLTSNATGRQGTSRYILEAMGTNALPAFPVILSHMGDRFPNGGTSRRLASSLYGLYVTRLTAPQLGAFLPEIRALWDRHPAARKQLGGYCSWLGPEADFVEEYVLGDPGKLEHISLGSQALTSSHDFLTRVVSVLTDLSLDPSLAKIFSANGMLKPTTYFPERNILREAAYALGNCDGLGTVTPEEWRIMLQHDDASCRADILRAMTRAGVDSELLGMSAEPFLESDDPLLQARAREAWVAAGRLQSDNTLRASQGIVDEPERTLLALTLAGIEWRTHGDDSVMLEAIRKAMDTVDSGATDHLYLPKVDEEFAWRLTRLNAENPQIESALRHVAENSFGLPKHLAQRALQK